MRVGLGQGEVYWTAADIVAAEREAAAAALARQRAGEREPGISVTETASRSALESFRASWVSLKGRLGELTGLARNLADLQGRWERARVAADLRRQPGVAAAAAAGRARAAGLLARWRPVDAQLRGWLDTWRRTSEAMADVYFIGELTQLGALPLIPIAAVAAAGVVAATGLALLKEYARERALLADVERQVLTPEQAAALLRAGAPPAKPAGAVTAIMENLPTILAVGTGAVVLLWAVARRPAPAGA